MKIIITETQSLFLKRRLLGIDEFVKLSLKHINPEEYIYDDYLDEIVWQVLDKYDEMYNSEQFNNIEEYVRDKYSKTIKSYYLKHTE
jgi:hypothetical protein